MLQLLLTAMLSLYSISPHQPKIKQGQLQLGLWSQSVQFASSTMLLCAGNIYGAVPVDGWRDASIILMIIHQCVAYALYVTPVFFMWEKLVHTHDKPLWIRLPSRLPVGE